MSEGDYPVIVGLGELAHRPGDEGPTDPHELMAEAVRLAAVDCGAGKAALERLEVIAAAPSAALPDGDPASRVAGILGLEVETTRSSMQGGNGPQVLVNRLSERILAGEIGAAVVCGAESINTLAGFLKQGQSPDWPPGDPDAQPDETTEPERVANSDAETAIGLIAPIMAYPLLENAIRSSAGRSPAEHMELISGLWSRFSQVAEGQEIAWTRTAYSPDEIATPSETNRKVTLPYTKLLNSNIQVDQGGAVILCSAAVAEDLGIARERWVYVHAGARATDEWFVSERHDLHRSPAVKACGEAVFAHAGISASDLGPIDLYSCFPAAVQIAASELGLPIDDSERSLTSTGGLTFFGGPGNNYATHGVIAVCRQLREAPPGTVGLSTALGWYATKHAMGIYGNASPGRPFASLAPELEPTEARTVSEPGEYEATAETCTLIYERDGVPNYGILFALREDGSRALGKTDDPEVMTVMASDDFLGSRVALHADRSFNPV